MALGLWSASTSGLPQVRLSEGKGVRKVVSVRFLEGKPTFKFGSICANIKSRNRNEINSKC